MTRPPQAAPEPSVQAETETQELRKRLPRKRRKAQILDLAERLFAQKGYDGTSLRDVAEETGLTKAALYYHFPNKLDLYEAVVTARMEHLIALTEAAMAETDDPVARIRAFLLACASDMDADPLRWQFASTSFWTMEDADARARAVLLRDRFEDGLKQQIAAAITTGGLRPVDIGLLTRLLLSGLNMIPRWHRPDGGLSAQEVVEAYLDYTLAGVTARTS